MRRIIWWALAAIHVAGTAHAAVEAETLPLQREIDAAAARGGGEVVVPPGEHLTGGLRLKSNVSLVLSKDARLVGSADPADYPRDRRGALIFAENVTNIAVRGEGVVDGSGASFPVQNDSATRPRLLHFVRCRDVAVEGVTLQNSPSWTCFLQECERVRVKRVRIDAHANFNNDGLDIESKDVLVEDCDIDSDDDAICVKSHNPGFVVERVRVRNCRVASNCNFLKLGTRGHGGFRDIEFLDCTLSPCRIDNMRQWSKWLPRIPGVTDAVTGLAGIAVEMVDGGVLENVRFRNIDMTAGGVQTPVFIRAGSRTPPQKGRRSRLSGVVIENVKGRFASSIACSVTGVRDVRPENVVFRNVALELKGGGCRADALCEVPERETDYPENRMFDFQMLPASGFYLRHADDIRFENVVVSIARGARDERETVVADDCTGVVFSSCAFRPPDAPARGPERAGGVYPSGETAKVWLKPFAGWVLSDWRGRAVRNGAAALDGCVTLENLPCGYWVLESEAEKFPVVVVPDPASRSDDADGFLGVDSALSWISKPQFFDCPWYGGDTFRYVADLMRFAGVRRTRERLNWGEVQPDGDLAPQWSYYGENARRLKDRGIAVCGMFQSAPKWTNPIMKLPGDFAALYRFCERAAKELDAIDAWEFWNEEIEGFAPEAAWDYAAAMKAAALGFRAGRKGAKVLNGSLCFLPNGYDRALFENEMGKFIDVVNIHAYPALAAYPGIFGGRREFAVSVGEDGKAIWTTECGTMAVGTPALPGRNRRERRFSPGQELLLAEFFPKSQALMMMEGVARNYFFVFGAYCEDGGKKDFSVIRRDGFPAPAFAAISTANDKLAGRKLLGELDAAEGCRAFLFAAPDGSETVLFWSVSPLDSASRESPVSTAEPLCERMFRLAAPAGRYTVTDLCGTPSEQTAQADGLHLKATRFPAYVEGLRGLVAEKQAHASGTARRYEAAADEDLSVVIRADLDKRDFLVGGIKSIAKPVRGKGRIAFDVWNLSAAPRRGTLAAFSGGELRLDREEVEIPPMGCARVKAVYVPDGEGLRTLVVRGVFGGRKTSALAIDVEPMAGFFANCEKIPLAADDTANWMRNDSADEYECVKADGGVKFSVRWNGDSDRWFYPRYVFAEGESATDAEFLVFEAKSAQTGGDNRYVCQNCWLDAQSGESVRRDFPPTGTDWTRYCLDLSAAENPRTGRVGFGPSAIAGFRIGGNPCGNDLSFWIRNVRLLKRLRPEDRTQYGNGK